MNAADIRRICIVDYDGTLANTPEKPNNWKGGWWGHKNSMLPPHLPQAHKIAQEMPDFLNEKVLNEYHKAVAAPDALAVLMTGRHEGLKWLVLQHLNAFGIDPEGCEKRRAIFINGGGGGKTLRMKLENIERMVREFTNVDEVEMWEDRPEHTLEFRKYEEHLKTIRPNISLWVHEPPDWD
jgi:hypothetical protein